MKRVLFIAEMNEITKSLNEAMLSYFQVQLSMADQNLIGKLVQIFEPDIILIFLNGCYADVKGLRTVLKANREIPVVVVGSKYEFREYDLEADDGQLRKLTRPVGSQGIIRALCDGVGIDYTDYENAVLKKEDRRKHILFVDDNPLLLRNMKALVSGRYRVSIAVSGAQAFEILKKDCPDLIFLDYEMPVINGKMFLRAIRANQQFAGLPVIFLSAVADREYIQELLELKPEGYVLKPAKKERIMEMIEKYVGQAGTV